MAQIYGFKLKGRQKKVIGESDAGKSDWITRNKF